MRKLILITFVLLTYLNVNSQTIYSWTTGVDPGWISSNPTSNTLNWQPIAGFVSTNDFPAGNRYNNNQITSYTSPIINTTCSNASTVNVAMNIGYDLERRFDWGYFQYSIDGGTTWINPVATSGQNNLSGVNLSAYSPLTNWVSNTDIPNRKGWTNGIFNVNLNYIIPTSSSARFRFIFASDGTVNYYGPLWSQSDYYFDVYSFSVTCNPMLPIELISFDGYNKSSNNVLTWSTASENNNDYFTIEKSEDGVNWYVIDSVDGSGNSQSIINYNLVDNNYRQVINYYRLRQVDYDGKYELFDKIVMIDNRLKTSNIVKITNLLGQDIDENYRGVVVIQYDDGTTVKKIQ
jgi:hypothetical protein